MARTEHQIAGAKQAYHASAGANDGQAANSSAPHNIQSGVDLVIRVAGGNITGHDVAGSEFRGTAIFAGDGHANVAVGYDAGEPAVGIRDRERAASH